MAKFPEQLHLPTDSMGVQTLKKAAWNERRSRSQANFFTIGYMQRDIGTFLGLLAEAGVLTILDVRHAPVSMYKPDFSKTNLQRHLAVAGIDYIHSPQLGVPRDIRSKAVGMETRSSIWEWYDEYVTPFVNLHAFLNSGTHPVALLCVELDPTSCHRHRLAMKLERQGLRGFDL